MSHADRIALRCAHLRPAVFLTVYASTFFPLARNLPLSDQLFSPLQSPLSPLYLIGFWVLPYKSRLYCSLAVFFFNRQSIFVPFLSPASLISPITPPPLTITLAPSLACPPYSDNLFPFFPIAISATSISVPRLLFTAENPLFKAKDPPGLPASLVQIFLNLFLTSFPLGTVPTILLCFLKTVLFSCVFHFSLGYQSSFNDAKIGTLFTPCSFKTQAVSPRILGQFPDG